MHRKVALTFGVMLVLLLVACAPATPQVVEKIVKETVVVEKEVAVEKVVKETVVVEKEVQVESESNWEEEPYIKIGSPGVFTGPNAGVGLDLKDGLTFAVERMNAAGGVLGKEIQIVWADIKNQSSEECELAFQAVERAGVYGLFPGANFIGSACVHSGGTRPQPMFHDCASKEYVDAVLANLPDYGNVFQMCASERYYGPNAVEIMTSALPMEYSNKKMALTGGNITYDMYIQAGIKEAAAEIGWEIVLDDTYQYDNTEFGPQLAKIRAENPAIIYALCTSQPSAVAFMNQFLQNPTQSVIYIQWSPVSPEFIGTLQEKANGVTWATLVAGLPNEENAQYAEEFETRFNRPPGAGLPYFIDDHLQIWKLAVEECGAPDAWDCMNEYIRTLDEHPFEGRVGKYGMNQEIGGYEALSGTDWIPLQFLQIQDKKNVTLYLGTTPVEGTEFQVPPWME